VKGVGEFFTVWQGDAGAVVLVHIPAASPVGRSMRGGRLVPHQFHDVNLPAGWPPSGAEIITQHPYGWPDALALGQFGSDVHSAVLKGLKALRLQASRRVPRAFLPSGDGQIAISYRAVFRTVGVILPLVVAPSGRAEVVRPVVQVHTGSVKFIRPHQGHALVGVGGRIALAVTGISRAV